MDDSTAAARSAQGRRPPDYPQQASTPPAAANRSDAGEGNIKETIESPPRMLIEVAPRETPQELDRLITQAARKNLLDVDKTEAALARHPAAPGSES